MATVPTVIVHQTASVQIDKNDIIAIQVAKAERLLNQELATATQVMKDHDKTLKKLRADLETSYAQSATAATAAAHAALEALSKEYDGFKIGNVVHATTADGLRVVLGLGNGYPRLELAKTIPYTPDQQTLQQQIATTMEALAQAQNEVVAARQRLSKIGTLERQYRAALAEKTLASSTEGQQILDAIASDARADVLALPVS